MLDNNRFDGKVALVTGAGGEIGAASIRLMAARGARIVAVDRDAGSLQRLSAALPELDLITCEADVADEDAVRRYVGYAQSRTGRIDIFFNNAGIEGPVCPIADYPLADFRRVIDVNVIGVFLGLKHVIPAMHAIGGGSIVNSTSVAGLAGSPGICAYNAGKHAVIGLTRSAAAEWAGKGIRINSINPGPIASRMMRSLAEGMAPARPTTCTPGSVRLFRLADMAVLKRSPHWWHSLHRRMRAHGAVFTIDGGFTSAESPRRRS